MGLKMLATHKSLSHLCQALLYGIANETMVSHSHMKQRDTHCIYRKTSVQNLNSLALSIASKNKNKAVYTAISVACGWAGAVLNLCKPRNSEIRDQKLDDTDRRTDESDGHSVL